MIDLTFDHDTAVGEEVKGCVRVSDPHKYGHLASMRGSVVRVARYGSPSVQNHGQPPQAAYREFHKEISAEAALICVSEMHTNLMGWDPQRGRSEK